MNKKKSNKFFLGSLVVFLILLGVDKAILVGMHHIEAGELGPATATTSTK